MSRRSDFESLSSEELAKLAQAGCEESFSELVRRHSSPLMRFLVRRLRSQHDAEDVAQETLVRAHRQMARFEPRYRFTTWLFTIAARLASDSRRKRREVSIEVVPDGVDEASPIRVLEATETTGNLWRQVAGMLPAGQYEVLWLRYGEDRSMAEIAQAVGKTQIHVKVLLHRARLRLAKRLRNEGGGTRAGQGRSL